MKCLAVNAANKELSIAFVSGGECLHLFRTAETRDQGNILLSHMQTAIENLGLEFADIDVFGVVTGPGSFTGIRIALAAMRGLSMACEKPLVGVSSFDLFKSPTVGQGVNLVALESWREELYFQLVDHEGQALVHPVNQAPELFLTRIEGFLKDDVLLSGDAAEKMKVFLPLAKIVNHVPTAEHAAYIAIQKYKNNPTLLEKPVPFYLREPDVTLSTRR